MTDSPRRISQAEINELLLATEHLIHGIGRRTTRGGFIAIASQIVRLIVQIGTTFVLARLLVPDDFGVVALGVTAFAFITMFTEFGITTAAVQVKRLDQDTASGFLLVSLAISAIVVFAALLASPAIVWLFKDDRVPAVLIGLSLSAPIGALGSQHYAILMRNMKWVSMQSLGLSSLIAGGLAAILAAWLFDARYWALVVQSITSATISSVLAWTICPWRPSLVRDWSGVKGAVKFSLNTNASWIVSFFHRQLDSALIGWRWGSTELGYYSRAYNLLLAPHNLVSGPLSTAIIPALSRLHGEDQPAKWRTGYLDALIVVTTIGGGLTAILFGAAVPIINLVFGPGWEKTQLIFSYLVIAMLGATATQTTAWIYVSRGTTDRMLRWSLLSTPVFVASFIIGLPFGAAGVALSYALAQLLAFLPCFWMATRFTNLTVIDILAACMPNIVVTVLVGAALRISVGQSGFFLDMAAIAAACVAYAGLIAGVGWYWPPYRRVRDRGVAILAKPLSRLGLNATRP